MAPQGPTREGAGMPPRQGAPKEAPGTLLRGVTHVKLLRNLPTPLKFRVCSGQTIFRLLCVYDDIGQVSFTVDPAGVAETV